MTSHYRLKISPREDQICECGSILFQGGPRGNMDARMTPFRSHAVPLGSPLGHKRQFHCRFTLLCCFSGRSQHSTESAPRPLSYGGRGRRRPFYFILIVFLFPKTQPTPDKLSTKALKLQGSGAKAPFYCSLFIWFLLPKAQPTQDRLWEAKTLNKTAVKWLVGYGVRRATSKYKQKISPRGD